MSVRPLAEADIPQVADLYWTCIWLRRKGPTPPGLHTFPREIGFSASPFLDSASSIPSCLKAKAERLAVFWGRWCGRCRSAANPSKWSSAVILWCILNCGRVLRHATNVGDDDQDRPRSFHGGFGQRYLRKNSEANGLQTSPSAQYSLGAAAAAESLRPIQHSSFPRALRPPV